MSPTCSKGDSDDWRAPRVSGDEPIRADELVPVVRCSPRERG